MATSLLTLRHPSKSLRNRRPSGRRFPFTADQIGVSEHADIRPDAFLDVRSPIVIADLRPHSVRNTTAGRDRMTLRAGQLATAMATARKTGMASRTTVSQNGAT